MRIHNLAVIALTLLTAQPAAAADTPVSTSDPKAFFTMLEEMGYAPKDLTIEDTSAHLIFTVDGFPSDMTLSNCKARKDCSYVFISSIYDDVVNPPDSWLLKTNATYDMVKVGRSSDKLLLMSAAHVLEGVPRSTLRKILDFWAADTGAIGQDAQKAGITTAKTPAH